MPHTDVIDSRIATLAELLLDHSCQLQSGEKLLIEAFDLPDAQLVSALITGAAARNAIPVVEWRNNRVLRSLYHEAGQETFELLGRIEKSRMEQMDAYIGVRGAVNSHELEDVPREKLDLVQRVWWKPVHHDVRVPKTRWVVLRYPTPSMAQSAHMSTAAFEEFYFDVCTADYAQMAKNQEPLRERMLAADQVHITGPDTDLRFSIADIPVIPCNGRRNIPDGEVFTAPVRDSVNGTIQYNTPSLYQGTVFDRIFFRFEAGKIVEARCQGETDKLNQILDSDEGARYIGEWSLGCNNRITRPMLDTLFDEKIGGSMHLTPGNAYETADNGNRSQVHWDIIFNQRAAHGGGEVYFDGELIRRDGFFVPDDLQPLNEGLE